MQRIIVIITLIVIVSRVVSWARRNQQKAREQEQQSPPPRRLIKLPWEFEDQVEISSPADEIRTEEPTRRPSKIDDEFTGLVAGGAISDEEDFKEESIVPPRSLKTDSEKPSTPLKVKQAQIAGIPINSQSIRHGIIVSEILRRPNF